MCWHSSPEHPFVYAGAVQCDLAILTPKAGQKQVIKKDNILFVEASRVVASSLIYALGVVFFFESPRTDLCVSRLEMCSPEVLQQKWCLLESADGLIKKRKSSQALSTSCSSLSPHTHHCIFSQRSNAEASDTALNVSHLTTSYFSK